jgi:hypothetical protein
MDILVEKIGEREGKERFVLVNSKTHKVITVKDVSEPTLRKFLRGKGAKDDFIDECLQKARKRFEKTNHKAEEEDDFDIFNEVDFAEES